jgi:hypothetical protein
VPLQNREGHLHFQNRERHPHFSTDHEAVPFQNSLTRASR